MAIPLPDPLTLVARQSGDVRIHTFVSSFAYNNIGNATHIIESKAKLVIVDAQFLAPYAKSFRDYADSFGKPIERLYLSHRHPDHWFGLGVAFGDLPIRALPETIGFLEEHGEDSRRDHWKMGDFAPSEVVVPTEAVGPSEKTIDGVRYVFSKVTDTEIDHLLAIELPAPTCLYHAGSAL